MAFISSIARKENLLEDEEHVQNIGELYKLYGSVRDEKSNDDWVYTDALDDMSNESKVKAIQLYQQHHLAEDLRILLSPQLLNAMNFSKEAVSELKKKVPEWYHEHQQARTDSELKLAREVLKAQPDNVQKLLVKIFEDAWDLSSPK